MLLSTRKLLIALSVALFAGHGFAQLDSPVSPPTTGTPRKGMAPVAKETLRVQFPRPQAFTLDNGMRLLVLEDHKLPTVSISMSVLAGSFFEAKDKQGLASLTASMLDEGTKSRTSAQIAAETDRLGASLGAVAQPGGERASVMASGLSEDTHRLLEILADIVQNPVFPEAQFEKVQQQTITGLQQSLKSPRTLARVAALRSIYGDAAPSRVLPLLANVQSLKAKDLAAFHARFYRPDRAILGIAGDVNPEEVFQKVNALFGDWKPGRDPREARLPRFKAPSKSRAFLVERPGSVQTVLYVTHLGLTRKDPDYPALVVMNQILGASPMSRLEEVLREKKGYTYSARSSTSAPRYPGFFGASLEVRNDVTTDALRDLLSELKRIQEQTVPAIELERARRSIIGSFALSLESPSELLDYAMALEQYGLPVDYWDRFPSLIEAVSAEDVQRVARKYVASERLQIVAVGEKAVVEAALKPYGPIVELKDLSGN